MNTSEQREFRHKVLDGLLVGDEQKHLYMNDLWFRQMIDTQVEVLQEQVEAYTSHALRQVDQRMRLYAKAINKGLLQ